MAKIFRKFRSKSILQSKGGKYFIYAIGEVLLVVIGILIAFQVNKWNSQRIDREKEQVFLAQILAEFEANEEQLVLRRSQNESSFAASIQIIDEMREGTLIESNLDTVAEKMFLLIRDFSYNPLNGSVNALVNSASFGLIQNEELRLLLVQWKDVVDDYILQEKMGLEQNANFYKPYLAKTFKRNLENLPRFDLKAASFDRSILESYEFENQIIERMAGLRNVLYSGNLEEVEKHLAKMIELTRQEIKVKDK